LKNIVLCISFGHTSEQVKQALEGAVQYAAGRQDTVVLVADDCSGQPPVAPPGAVLIETPSRRGFAGVVSYVLDVQKDVDGRLLLINPDAALGKEAVDSLLSQATGIGVPRVLNGQGHLENIRSATTATEQLKALLFGEQAASRSVKMLDESIEIIECPPYAPSGSVLAIPIGLLRAVPLRSDFFWLEQSDWVYRYARGNGPVRVSIHPFTASHTGASTSLRFPVSVAASQLRSKINFVNDYGNLMHRALLPLGVFLRAVRFGLKTRSLSNSVFLLQVGLGLQDWRVNR
jgi:GT2 family glycosyltransferase